MAVKLSKFEQAVLDNRLRLIKQEPAIDALVEKEMRRLVKQWNQELRNIVGSKSRLSATDVASLERKLVSLRGKLEASTKAKIKQIEREIGRTAKATHTSEVFKHTQMIDTHVAKFDGRGGVSFNGLNRKAINAAYRQSFPPGMMKAAFGKVPPVVAKRLRRDIAEAIANGWKVDQLARHWRNMHGAAGATRNGTKAVARTMVMQASSNAQLHAYTSQDHLIKGVQWEATFDSRTCPMCASKHARKYSKDEAPSQPAHLNCRCTWLPVFIDESLNTKFDTRTAYKKPDNSSIVFKKQSREFDQFLKGAGKVTQREFFGSAFKMRAWRAGQLDLDQLVDVHGRWISDRVARKMVDQTWLKNIGKLRTLDDIAGPPATPRIRPPAGNITPGAPPIPKEPPKPKPKPPVELPPGQESTLGKLDKPKKPKAPPVEKPPAPPVQPPSKGMPARGKDWQPNKDAHLGAHDVDLEGIPKKFHDAIHRGAKRVTEAFPSIRVKTLGGSKSFDRVWGNPDSPFRTRSGRKKTRRMPKGAAAVYSRPSSGGFGPDFKPGVNDHVHIKSAHLPKILKDDYAEGARRINQQHIEKAKRYEAAAKSYDEAASMSAAERAAKTAEFDRKIDDIRDRIKVANLDEGTELRKQLMILRNEREGFANYSQKEHERWRKFADEATARKRWTVSDNLIRDGKIMESIEATIAHEYGHVVMFQAKNGEYFRDAWKRALGKHGVTRKDRLSLSEYGASNDDELFAEAFSAWAMGYREWIPDNVFNALDEVMVYWNNVARAASYQ